MRLSEPQKRMIALVKQDGDPWAHYDQRTQQYEAFARTLRSLERRGIIRDGRHICEDGHTTKGPRYEMVPK